MNNQDLELALPDGYWEEPNRCCTFGVTSKEPFTPGYKGLAWAVMLKAVEDGCNRDWLKEIAHYYDIPAPKGMLDRAPHRRIKMNKRAAQLMDVPIVTTFKIVLVNWCDGLRIPRWASKPRFGFEVSALAV